jgi:hypothetical protein
MESIKIKKDSLHLSLTYTVDDKVTKVECYDMVEPEVHYTIDNTLIDGYKVKAHELKEVFFE